MTNAKESGIDYELLVRELPTIAKIVNAFSADSVQQQAFEELLASLRRGTRPPIAGRTETERGVITTRPQTKKHGERDKRSAGARLASARARLEALVGENFFSERKTTGDVVKKLGEEGYHYQSRRVAMALLTLTRNKVLRREGPRGEYKYVKA
jgi:hypothetical protein